MDTLKNILATDKQVVAIAVSEDFSTTEVIEQHINPMNNETFWLLYDPSKEQPGGQWDPDAQHIYHDYDELCASIAMDPDEPIWGTTTIEDLHIAFSVEQSSLQ